MNYHRPRSIFASRVAGPQLLEVRLCLTAIAFSPHEVQTAEIHGPQAIHAADLDGDGDLDLLSASWWDDKVAWLENTDGVGKFSPPKSIIGSVNKASAVAAADIDGDGDLDVVSTSYSNGSTFWVENKGSARDFGAEAVISPNTPGVRDVEVTDIDGDGDFDVLTASWRDDRVVWYENTDGKGTFGAARTISATLNGARSVTTADFDGDGDIDVAAAGDPVSANSRIAWYENSSGDFRRIIVSTEFEGVQSLEAADFNGDGNTDLIATSLDDNTVVWFDNVDGKGDFQRRTVTTDILGPNSVIPTDIDADGDLDVVVGAWFEGRLVWYDNVDGAGSFGTANQISDGGFTSRFLVSADFNNDGLADIAQSEFNADRISWHVNLANGELGRRIPLTVAAADVRFVESADLDGDGDLDVLTASRGDQKFAWHENLDGKGSYGIQRIIGVDSGEAKVIRAGDIDGDGDLDVLALASRSLVTSGAGGLMWYENQDAKGDFSAAQEIATDLISSQSTHLIDVDGDGDLDAISDSTDKPFAFEDEQSDPPKRTIFWYENVAGEFQSRKVIAEDLRHGRGFPGTQPSYIVPDIDGDGDADLVHISKYDEEPAVSWYENDGQGNFGSAKPIAIDGDDGEESEDSEVGPSAIAAADIDADGDLDLLVKINLELNPTPERAKIIWLENTDGRGTFISRLTIEFDGEVTTVDAADIDGDGDADIVFAGNDSSLSGPGIGWFANNGNGSIDPEQNRIDATLSTPETIKLTDLDKDNDVDVLSASWFDSNVSWYENRIAGDADDNGEVDFEDFLKLAANFGDPVADWEDGDFDNDGSVSFADFLILAANFGTTQPDRT